MPILYDGLWSTVYPLERGVSTLVVMLSGVWRTPPHV